MCSVECLVLNAKRFSLRRGDSLNIKHLTLDELWTLNDFPTPRSSPLTFNLLTINLISQYTLNELR